MNPDSGLASSSSGRIAVLLGAGASADADLPLTSELADMIVERANHRAYKRPWVKILNAVYGAMSGYTGLSGENPRTAVNVETLISSLRLLQVRASHEVAPFVSTWIPALSDLSVSEPGIDDARDLVRAISDHNESNSDFLLSMVTRAVASIARDEIRPDVATALKKAEDYVIDQLIAILKSHRDVSYLSPLIDLSLRQPGGLDVITLNYDLTVEDAAKGRVVVETGISDWNPGDPISFPERDRCLNLIKVHGSLDWVTRRNTNLHYNLVTPFDLGVDEGASLHEPNETRPWLVVGDRDKLGTDGPTIELNHAARTSLRRTDHLAVVGYSFNDQHINSIIRDWINGDVDRTISIVSPGWDSFGGNPFSDPSTEFRHQLVDMFGAGKNRNKAFPKPKVLPILGTAKDELWFALNYRAAENPDPLVSMRKLDAKRIALNWHGPDLTDISVKANVKAGMTQPKMSSPRSRPLSMRLKGVNLPLLRFDSWKHNSEKVFTFEEESDSLASFSISGASIFGGYEVRVAVQA